MSRLLVDTNILLLWVVGTHDRSLVRRHRRTSNFDVADFDVLDHEVTRCERLVTTAPLLTELSNLLGNDFHREAAPTVVRIVTLMVEVVSPKEQIVEHPGFYAMGYADVSILLALDHQTRLLTDDARLYAQALYEGRDAQNFNHLRALQR